MELAKYIKSPHIMGDHYKDTLRCFPIVYCKLIDSREVSKMEFGGRIWLPRSVQDYLMISKVQFPLLFKVKTINEKTEKVVYCGVHEDFLAENGRMYMPLWLMRNLEIGIGNMVEIAYNELPRATYVKFKPQSFNFYKIENPWLSFRKLLFNYRTLTLGETMKFRFNETDCYITIIEMKPKNVCSIFNIDDLVFDLQDPDVAEISIKVEPTYKIELTVKNGPTPIIESVTKVDSTAQVLPPEINLNPNTNPCLINANNEERTGNSAIKEKSIKTFSEHKIIVDTNYKPGNMSFIRTDYKSHAVLKKELQEKAQFPGLGLSTRPKK